MGEVSATKADDKDTEAGVAATPVPVRPHGNLVGAAHQSGDLTSPEVGLAPVLPPIATGVAPPARGVKKRVTPEAQKEERCTRSRITDHYHYTDGAPCSCSRCKKDDREWRQTMKEQWEKDLYWATKGLKGLQKKRQHLKPKKRLHRRLQRKKKKHWKNRPHRKLQRKRKKHWRKRQHRQHWRR